MSSAFQTNGFQNNAFQIERTPIDRTYGGAGHIVYKKRVKRHNISEVLELAMSEIYQAGTETEIPQETRLAFGKAVKPYAKGKQKIPDASKVDWSALERNVEIVGTLINLYEQRIKREQKLIDDDVIRLAISYFYQ